MTSHTSVNSKGATVSSDWFESLDFTGIDRNADGTVNTHGFLILTDKAQAGGVIGGTASEDIKIGDETDGKVEGNTGSNSSSSDSGSSSASSAAQIKTTTVAIADDQTPLAVTPAALPEGYTYEQTVVEPDGVLKASLLQKYYGQKVYFAVIFGKNAAMTIDMQTVTSAGADMKLGYTLVGIPAFAADFATIHAVPIQRTVLPFQATLHFNVGSAYAGKTAYIYLMDADAAKYILVKTMNVNENGNVAIDTEQFTDVIIMIAE